MARERDYAAEYEARQARAEAAGWDSFYAQREGRREAREFLDDRGIDYDASTVELQAEFMRDFAEDAYDRDSLYDIFFDWWPDADEQDFWDWLHELYGG